MIKAVSIATAHDLERVPPYDATADWLLLDAAPPPDATRPGGNARTFDWDILRGWSCRKPWFLAGGLTAGTLRDAVSRTSARYVDVSSGVESRRGVKSLSKIAAFLAEAERVGS